MIPHWTIPFLCNCVLPVVLLLVLFAAPLALIRFNDWYILSRAAQRESSAEDLEALFALEDSRAIGHLHPWSRR